MNIEITESNIIIGGNVISSTSDIEFILKTPSRKIDVETQRRLSISDNIGIRYWTHNEKIGEIQICLNENHKSEFLPKFDYHDSVTINDITVDWQTQINEEIIKKLKLLVDDDNLRFKILTYYFDSEKIKYSFTLDNQRLIKHISVSFH